MKSYSEMNITFFFGGGGGVISTISLLFTLIVVFFWGGGVCPWLRWSCVLVRVMCQRSNAVLFSFCPLLSMFSCDIVLCQVILLITETCWYTFVRCLFYCLYFDNTFYLISHWIQILSTHGQWIKYCQYWLTVHQMYRCIKVWRSLKKMVHFFFLANAITILDEIYFALYIFYNA